MSQAIGFIGTGTIGLPMAHRLLGAGNRLHVFDIDEAAPRSLVEAGAVQESSPAAVAELCRVVFTSLPGPEQVEGVVTGPKGLLERARAGDVHVDLTTNSLDAARAFHAQEARQGVDYLDAPVSGGAYGASQGNLTVMASGSKEVFDRVSPIMEAFASNRFYLGEVGNGTLVKLINNALFLGGGLLLQEGFVMAARAGLDPEQLLEIIRKSSGAAYAGMAGLLLGRDFDNPIFKLSIAAKDVALAAQSAKALDVVAPVTDAVSRVYELALEAGLGDRAFFATLAALEEAAGVELPRLE